MEQVNERGGNRSSSITADISPIENDMETLKNQIVTLKSELDRSRKAQRSQEMKYQRVMSLFATKFREKEEEIKRHLENKHNQLTSVLRALYIFECKLIQEKKSLMNQLGYRDSIIKLQRQEISKLKKKLNEIRNARKSQKKTEQHNLKNENFCQMDNRYSSNDSIAKLTNNKPDLISSIGMECERALSEMEQLSPVVSKNEKYNKLAKFDQRNGNECEKNEDSENMKTKKENLENRILENVKNKRKNLVSGRFDDQNLEKNTYLISSLDEYFPSSKSMLHVRRSSITEDTVSDKLDLLSLSLPEESRIIELQDSKKENMSNKLNDLKKFSAELNLRSKEVAVHRNKEEMDKNTTQNRGDKLWKEELKEMETELNLDPLKTGTCKSNCHKDNRTDVENNFLVNVKSNGLSEIGNREENNMAKIYIPNSKQMGIYSSNIAKLSDQNKRSLQNSKENFEQSLIDTKQEDDTNVLNRKNVVHPNKTSNTNYNETNCAKQEYNVDRRYKQKLNINKNCMPHLSVKPISVRQTDSNTLSQVARIDNDEETNEIIQNNNKKCQFYPSLPPKPVNIKLRDHKIPSKCLKNNNSRCKKSPTKTKLNSKSIIDVTITEEPEDDENELYVVSNSALSEEDILKLDVLKRNQTPDKNESSERAGIDVQFLSEDDTISGRNNNHKIPVRSKNEERGESKIVQTVSTLLLDPNESDNETQPLDDSDVCPKVSQMVQKFENIMCSSPKEQKCKVSPVSNHAITIIQEENMDIRTNFEEFHLVDKEIEYTCKGKIKENGRLEADGEENSDHSERTNNTRYEHFLEETGLSQKSILNPSRILSNHRNVMKPKDVKYRSRIKAASIGEKSLDSNGLVLGSVVKYWTEPYL